jgi:hypothetical protein
MAQDRRRRKRPASGLNCEPIWRWRPCWFALGSAKALRSACANPSTSNCRHRRDGPGLERSRSHGPVPVTGLHRPRARRRRRSNCDCDRACRYRPQSSVSPMAAPSFASLAPTPEPRSPRAFRSTCIPARSSRGMRPSQRSAKLACISGRSTARRPTRSPCSAVLPQRSGNGSIRLCPNSELRSSFDETTDLKRTRPRR